MSKTATVVDGILIETCPCCGKAPKIYRDYSYKSSGFGEWCTIRCKPFLRSTHLQVEAGGARWEGVVDKAVEQWNRNAMRMRMVGELDARHDNVVGV